MEFVILLFVLGLLAFVGWS